MELARVQPRTAWNPFARLRDALARPGGRNLPVRLPGTPAGGNGFAPAAVAVALRARPLGAEELGGIAVLVIGAALVEAFPVPMELEGMAAGGVWVAGVFFVGAAGFFAVGPA